MKTLVQHLWRTSTKLMLGALLVTGAVSSVQAQADSVIVKFTVNTSTIRDTVQAGDLVQIRGAVDGSERTNYFGQTINWGSGSIALEHAGGDYWTTDLILAPGDTLAYKIYTGKAGAGDAIVDHATGGWEGGDNKLFIVPEDASGTIVAPVVFFNRVSPLVSKQDSIALFFRVNVGAQSAVGDLTQSSIVGVRGTPSVMRNPDNWGSNGAELTREPAVEGSQNVFFSGLHWVPSTQAGESFNYKFVIQNGATVIWESTPDRPARVGQADTTLGWNFFSGQRPPSRPLVNANIAFEVNVGVLEDLGFFNRAVGDSVQVKGDFNGWGSGSKAAFNATTNTWLRQENLVREVGSTIKYKYFIQWAPSRFDSESNSFINNLIANNGWEEPGQFGGSDRVYELTSSTTQTAGGGGVQFYNSIPPYGVIRETVSANNVMPVTFKVDMTPALSHSVPFNPATDTVFIFIETTFFALTQGLPTGDDIANRLLNAGPELRERIMLTPVQGEPNMYSITMPVELPTENHIGFTLVYRKSDMSTVHTGGGTSPGRRYYRYITPLDVSDLDNVIWPDSYELAPITWKLTNLDFETPPSYQPTSVENNTKVDGYALSQNYPNPFNPSTAINFTLPQSGRATLTVYNVLGQRVATLVNGVMSAGSHTVNFNAANLASGVYLYELRAGNTVITNTMMLVK